MGGKTAFSALIPRLFFVLAGILLNARSPASPQKPAPRGQEKWEVQVLDQATGRPVPLAKVYFLDKRDEKAQEEAWQTLDPYSQPIQRIFRELGTLRRTGPKGKTTIPKPGPQGIFVGAEFLGKWGAAYLLPGSRPPHVVRIGKVTLLAAQVVDRTGAPKKGVPLILQVRSKTGNSSQPAFILSKTRGPKGLARVHLFPGHPPGIGRKKDLVARLALWIPLKKPVDRIFSLDSPPSAPVRLVLPPTGSVQVLVEDAKNPASPPACSVTLQKAEKDSPPVNLGPNGPGRSWPQIPPTVRARGGKAFFPFVGLDLELEARAFRLPFPPGGLPEETQPAEGPGPAAPGASVTFRLAFSKGGASFSGRFLDPSGKPLANTWIECLAGPFVGGIILIQKAVDFQTNEKGEFHFRIQGTTKEAKAWSFWFETKAKAKHWILKIHPPGGVVPGKHDLGDLRFKKKEKVLLVSGKVVDERGVPVEGAEVRGGFGNTYGPPTHTDSKGNFLLLGEKGGSLCRVYVKKKGFFPEKPCLAPVGTKGVEIVLRRGGSLAGSVLADPGFPLNQVRIDSVWKQRDLPPLRLGFTPREVQKNKTPSSLNIWDFFGDIQVSFDNDEISIPIHAEEDGSFRWESLPAGKTEIRFFFPGYSNPFLKIPEVRILPGKENRDPRLQKIDLRGKIGYLELDLVDESGLPVKGATLFLGREYGEFISIHRGEKIFFYKDRFEKKSIAFQAFIRARGYRQVRIPLISGKRKIVLQKGIPIEIAYEGKMKIPSPPKEIGFYLNHLPGGKKSKMFYTLDSTPRAVLNPDKRAKVRLPCPGRYSLIWFEESPSIHGIFGKTRYIQVEDKLGQVFHVKDE